METTTEPKTTEAKTPKARKPRKPAKQTGPEWYIDLRTFEEVGYTRKQYESMGNFDRMKYRAIRLLLKTKVAPADLFEIISELEPYGNCSPYPPMEPKE